MSKKQTSKSKSGCRVTRIKYHIWLVDPVSGRMLRNSTDKRLLENASKKEAKKVVPPTGDEAVEAGHTGSVESAPKPDSAAKD